MSASDLAQLLLDWSTEFVRLSMHDIYRCARSSGLSFAQMNVLMHLYYQGPREVMEFAEFVQVSPAGASQMVERLVQQGWVVRVESPDDRRVRHVHLTGRGRLLVEESIALRQQWADSLVASLSAEQQAVVSEAMCLLNSGS
jgi:MarR family transcriptional regulator, 2-MHQ and catechol-resistance regulon repressor